MTWAKEVHFFISPIIRSGHLVLGVSNLICSKDNSNALFLCEIVNGIQFRPSNESIYRIQLFVWLFFCILSFARLLFRLFGISCRTNVVDGTNIFTIFVFLAPCCAFAFHYNLINDLYSIRHLFFLRPFSFQWAICLFVCLWALLLYTKMSYINCIYSSHICQIPNVGNNLFIYFFFCIQCEQYHCVNSRIHNIMYEFSLNALTQSI